MKPILWILTSYLMGAIPFSLLVGKMGMHKDIRQYGDTNPGATNVLRAGSKGWALIALLLDMLKGALPVGLAYTIFDIRGPAILLIALAPVAGHIFSPFLNFHGGKAVAVTGGIWIGLTYGVITGVGMAFMVIGYAVQTIAGWAVALGLIAMGIALPLLNYDPLLWYIWLGNALLLIWTHRADFKQRPQLRTRWKR